MPKRFLQSCALGPAAQCRAAALGPRDIRLIPCLGATAVPWLLSGLLACHRDA